MAFINVPTFINQLKIQLGNSAAWIAAGGTDAKIHYPIADANDTDYPAAILMQEDISQTKHLFGMSPVPNADLMIMIFDKTSTGLLEQLAIDIGDEICVDNGLVNLSVTSITPSTVPSESETADGTQLIYECAISLTFGLDI